MKKTANDLRLKDRIYRIESSDIAPDAFVKIFPELSIKEYSVESIEIKSLSLSDNESEIVVNNHIAIPLDFDLDRPTPTKAIFLDKAEATSKCEKLTKLIHEELEVRMLELEKVKNMIYSRIEANLY